MCRRITCSICKKVSWAGCGMHVEQVLRGVKDEDRCKCREKKSANINIPTKIPINPNDPNDPNANNYHDKDHDKSNDDKK